MLPTLPADKLFEYTFQFKAINQQKQTKWKECQDKTLNRTVMQTNIFIEKTARNGRVATHCHYRSLC